MASATASSCRAWVKGSLLTDHQTRLPPALYHQFLARYQARLLPLLENAEPFFYKYPRLFLWGQK